MGAGYLALSHSLAVHTNSSGGAAHTTPNTAAPTALHVSIVPPSVYCARVADGASYGEANRDVSVRHSRLCVFAVHHPF
jgi:hypothetical protein